MEGGLQKIDIDAALSVIVVPQRGASGSVVDWQYAEVSGPVLEVLGKGRDEVLGHRLSEVVPEQFATLHALWSRALASGEPGSIRLEHGPFSFVVSALSLGDRVACTAVDVTSLHESEARYRLLADHVQDVIWVFDLGLGRMTYVSPSITALRGLSVEEALAEPFERSLTPESLTEVMSLLARVFEPGSPDRHVGIFDQPCKDGSIKHVEITTTLVRDEAGRPAKVVGVSRDATERIAAERARLVSEKYLSAIFDLTLAGLIVVRLSDQRLVSVNDAWLRQIGWTRQEVIGKTTLELGLYPRPEERQRIYEALDDGGVVLPMETHLRRKSGEEALFLLTASTAEIGGERCAIGAWHDITALRQADDALRRSEERFRALIEMSSDMLVLVDEGGRVLFSSPSVTERLGWSAAEILGQHTTELVHPDDVAKVSEQLAALLQESGVTSKLGMRLRHKQGSFRVVECDARNLLHEPAVRAVVINARDVTERQQLEDQFRQAQKLESVGRLAGGVAHDFNNLLTVILSCASALKDDLAAGLPGNVEDAEEIHAAGQRAAALTRQLLAFARKQVVAMVPLDLNAVVRQSEKLLRRVLGEDIELLVRLQPGLWNVMGDLGQIEQAIMNLAVNARDAMPDGGTLSVETANVRLDEGTEWVRLTVRDTGAGIPDEIREHLFEPFFTTKAAGKGTGLGLATVYGIVQQAGGRVELQSQLGRGTTFELSFPRSSGPVRPASELPAAALDRGDEQVLVAEDDAPVRAIIVRALRRAGYRVLAAQNGADALAMVTEMRAKPDLLITDVVMPGMDGRTLVEAARRQQPALRVLYLSGYTHDIITAKGVSELGIELLAKPFTERELLGRVRVILDG